MRTWPAWIPNLSTKRPDVLRAPPRPEEALTLAEMHVAGWRLVACCNRCSLKLRANLPAMIRTFGPDKVWWGETPPCPNADCDMGSLVYSAQSIGGGSWVSLKPRAPATLVSLWGENRRWPRWSA